MTKIALKFVQKYADRHGKMRRYFRRPGQKKVALPGLPGSAEFMAAYQQALENVREPVGVSKTTPGSISALIVEFYGSSDWHPLASSTKATYRGILERFREEYGAGPVRQLKPSHIRVMMDKKAATPAAANNFLRTLHMLMSFAVKRDWRQDDPTMGVQKVRHSSQGFRTWTDDDIAAYRAQHPPGSRARLALELLLNTGSRRSDVVKLGRQHIQDGRLVIRQQKTKALVHIPILPSTASEIEAAPRDRLTFLVTGKGKPFTPNGFYNWFSDWAREAGIVEGPGPHGLRKACARRLAEAGCSSHEIAAITGHKTLKEVERYTREANSQLLSDSAMARLKD